MKNLPDSRPTAGRLLICLYIGAVMILLSAWVVSVRLEIPFALFTRDPADITQSSPFLGVISNICILLWCATAAICFFLFYVLVNSHAKRRALFFLIAGLITSLLLLDDLFLLHERIFPQYFHWRQRYIILSYFFLILAWLVTFREIIFKSNVITLLLAFVFFFMSIVADGLAAESGAFTPFHHLFEDGFKLFGIASFLGYFWETSFLAIAPAGGFKT